ncbi:endocuticle structural glycoprotein ABD-5 [Drosophila busckii]|uniref:endocuticle structural glycoprotein ABD-5 n=1 Tax=Drosophila busckii TaxID=30019 RepID=UPI0014333B5F|nr:endocuticle structural glycoprotein ABD-5 [Drosophila busckii]
MLKLLFSLCALCLCLELAAAAALHTSPTHPPVAILESAQEKNKDGSYHFSYSAEDGTHREESAELRNPGTKDEYLEITGSYSYLDADGKEVLVHYKADNHGFVPEGGNILPSISLAAKLASEQVDPAPHTSHEKPSKF